MAKKKLSAKDKAELAGELTQAIKAGTPVAQVVKATSEKWKITGVTARWYLKKLGLVTPKRRRTAAGKRGPGRPAKQGQKRGPGRPKGSRNRSTLIPSAGKLRARMELALKRAKEARKLIPRWSRLVAREAELRQSSQRLERELARVSRGVRAAQEAIGGLV